MKQKLRVTLITLLSFQYVQAADFSGFNGNKSDSKIKSFSNIDQLSQNAFDESSKDKIDFFELGKKYQYSDNTSDPSSWDNSHLVNMSHHDRSQYYLNNHNYEALNYLQDSKRTDDLMRAKNRGAISNKKYKNEMYKNQKKLSQSSNANSLKFSVPYSW